MNLQVHEDPNGHPIEPFARWLEWLDSHNGRLYRRTKGGKEDDWDIAALLPNPQGGQRVFTVGDLRRLVNCCKGDKP